MLLGFVALQYNRDDPDSHFVIIGMDDSSLLKEDESGGIVQVKEKDGTVQDGQLIPLKNKHTKNKKQESKKNENHKPFHTPRVVLFSVAVGESYRRGVDATLRRQACYAHRHNMARAIDTRNMYEIYDALHLKEEDVGKYYGNMSWYQDHGWRWAWGKAFSLLSLLETGKGFDWVVYLDPDVEIGLPEIGMKELFEHAKGIAESSGYDWDLYHMIIMHTGPIGGPTNNDIIILRRSKEAIRFLRMWIRHSDCECWVDQGAYYLEVLRWVSSYLYEHQEILQGRVNASSIDEAKHTCDERYSPENKEKAMRFLKGMNCFDPKQRAKSRRCTWTTPGPMMCGCSFINCNVKAFQTLGFHPFLGSEEKRKRTFGRAYRPGPVHVPPPALTMSNMDETKITPFHIFSMDHHEREVEHISHGCSLAIPKGAHIFGPNSKDLAKRVAVSRNGMSAQGITFVEWDEA